MTQLVIWKYPLAITDEQTLDVPWGAKPLSVGVQHGGLMLWMLVDDTRAIQPLRVKVIGTGNPADVTRNDQFIGTVQMGAFVWHVFVERWD